tara:strand:+ start:10 stop:303 length:294 start_codon:yes stop_codon:yes gene_type:complete
MELGMEKTDRIEQHLRKLQQDSTSNSEINRKILSCLIGDEVNGNSGLVHRVKEIDSRLKVMEDLTHKHDYTILLLKYVTSVIFGSVIIVLFKLIFKE